MKIELEIPDWAVDDRTLYLMSGIELVAFKRPFQAWTMKVGRCDGCGQCCEHLNPATNTFVSKLAFDGRCIFLKEHTDGRKLCGLGVMRPFGCCIGINAQEIRKDCPEIYEELN